MTAPQNNASGYDIPSEFRGKALFFTGVTGFVGKVFLYKLLKEFPDIKNIYCLIRTKKKQSPQERFEKTIWSSQCYDPLRATLPPEEWERRKSKVILVPGDILEDRLGIAPDLYEKLCNEVNFIVHLAATVNFQEKLNLSVQMNVLGSLRMFTMAQRCKNLDAMVHTSTCYVNWNRHDGELIKEQIFPLPFDPEAMVKFILSLHDSMIADETKRLLSTYRFPNTYTFTKSMTEHLLMKMKPADMPLVIMRPSIIGCSLREPAPGWIDALTAAGGIFLTTGLGILKELSANPDFIADIVPVDFVCNTLIKTAFKTAIFYRTLKAEQLAKKLREEESSRMKKKNLSKEGKEEGAAEQEPVAEDLSIHPFVYHASTSGTLNPCKWKICQRSVVEYWQANPHPRQISNPEICLTPSALRYNYRWYVKRQLPLFLMKTAMSLPPPLGNPKKKALIKKLDRAIFRSADLNFQFKPFTTYEWRFDSANTQYLDEGLSEKSKRAFFSDAYDINWYSYVQFYSFGMVKYIMKDAKGRAAPTMPESGSEQFLRASL